MPQDKNVFIACNFLKVAFIIIIIFIIIFNFQVLLLYHSNRFSQSYIGTKKAN